MRKISCERRSGKIWGFPGLAETLDTKRCEEEGRCPFLRMPGQKVINFDKSTADVTE